MIIRSKWILLVTTAISVGFVAGQNHRHRESAAKYIDKALQVYDTKNYLNDIGSAILNHASCGGCKAAFAFILIVVKIKNEQEVRVTVATVCILLNLQTIEVCKGMARMFSPTVLKILQNTKLSPEEICINILGDTCGETKQDWRVEPSPVQKPPVQLLEPHKLLSPKIKVLQLTDLHIDTQYVEGTNANCKEPLCCRRSSGKVGNPSDMAGKWGDYRYCDAPPRLIDNMISHIKANHPDIAYIMWTGDVPPHDPWNQTKEEALYLIDQAAQQLADAFPKTPIYPVIGNHEAVPINNFISPNMTIDGFNMMWLYDGLDMIWKRWLPANTSETVRYGGYYSIPIRSGLRIISLNSNFCYNLNWWMLVHGDDPGGELKWLVNELQKAEDNKEKVHILSHIPPGSSDCLKVWSRNYNEIINRYEGTVMAQFYGHTHFDEFEVQYAMNDTARPINVAYISPSATPYNDLNPGYRVYYVDGDHSSTTRQIVDHETWIMNLTYANAKDDPVWYKSYSAMSAYNMTALRPQDWDVVITDMTVNDELFKEYYSNYWKQSDTKPNCDSTCRKERICDARSGRSHDRKHICGEIYNSMDSKSRRSWTLRVFKEFSIVTTLLFRWLQPNSA